MCDIYYGTNGVFFKILICGTLLLAFSLKHTIESEKSIGKKRIEEGENKPSTIFFNKEKNRIWIFFISSILPTEKNLS